MKSSTLVSILFALAISFAAVPGFGSESPSDVVAAPEFVRSHEVDVLLSRVLNAADAKDLSAIDALVTEIQTSPATAADDTYGLVATSICQTLSSTDFGSARDMQRQAIIEKCASVALASRPGLAPDQKAYFTSLPLLSDSLLTGTDWSVRRSARVDALIGALKATAPKAAASDPAPSQAKTGAIAEVKAYVTTIDRQQHDEHERQDAARTQIAAKYCANATEAYLIAAYSRAPYNLPELRTKTKASGLPKEAQWRILGKVIYAMRVAGAPVDGA